MSLCRRELVHILLIKLDNATLQGPLDTDILREYIKARSPLNYKWGPDIYNQQRTLSFLEHIFKHLFFGSSAWFVLAGWKKGLLCGRHTETNFQTSASRPLHRQLRSLTNSYIFKSSIMSWKDYSVENIYLFCQWWLFRGRSQKC